MGQKMEAVKEFLNHFYKEKTGGKEITIPLVDQEFVDNLKSGKPTTFLEAKI